MKKSLLLILLSVISFVASAEVYRVDIDDVTRVEASIDQAETPIEGLVNGMNMIDTGGERYLRIKAKPGVLFTEATIVDEYYKEERNAYISVDDKDGRQYVDFGTSFPEDEYLRIRTSDAGDARNATCTVKVDDPSKVKLMRSSSSDVIELAAGENTVSFDPKTENELTLEPTGKALYSVTKNGEALTAPYRYVIPVAQDDYIDIQANYPDKDCKVTFIFDGNGAEDFFTEVDVDDRPEFNWKDENFTVKAGSELSLKGNTTEFEVLAFTVNGASEIFTNPTKLLVVDDMEISVSVRRYASFTMTVNVDDPAKVHVFRGYSYNKDEITLTAGDNEVEITRNTPIISVVPAEGCYVNTLSITGYDYLVEELQRSPVLVGSLTDNDVLTITTGVIVRDKTAMVYLENLEAAEGYFKLLRADMSEVTGLNEGHNLLEFYDRDNQFRFETGGPVTAYVYVNEEQIEPAPGGFNYTPDLADGDVVKIFFGDAPERHAVTMTIDSDVADKVEVIRDHLCDVSALGNHTALNNSHYAVRAKDGADVELNVTVNGQDLAADEKGTSSFLLTEPTEIVVRDKSAGIDQITVDSVDEKIYNLQGIEISGKFSDLPSGIYIVGGRKVKK